MADLSEAEKEIVRLAAARLVELSLEVYPPLGDYGTRQLADTLKSWAVDYSPPPCPLCTQINADCDQDLRTDHSYPDECFQAEAAGMVK